MAHDVRAEGAPGLCDAAVGGELDEVGRLVVVQVVRRDEAEPDGRRRDALLEVRGAEREPVAQELERVIVAGRVVGRHVGHRPHASVRV